MTCLLSPSQSLCHRNMIIAPSQAANRKGGSGPTVPTIGTISTLGVDTFPNWIAPCRWGLTCGFLFLIVPPTKWLRTLCPPWSTSSNQYMRATCEVVANLCGMVLSQYGSPHFKPPPTPATDWINRPYAVTWILLDRQWESCREILILGFILYAIALDSSWCLKAWPPAFFVEIDRWQLSSSHWHGVIVDPASVQPTSIINFVHNVPVHYPWRDEWTMDPSHMLDPYSFTIHRFDLWERSGGPSSAADKSSALLQRVPIVQPTPMSKLTWVTKAQLAQPNPWHPTSPTPSMRSAPPTSK